MSDNNIKVDNIDKNGSMNVLGMNVSLNTIIGEQIIQQWFAQLTEDDLKDIYNQIDNYVLEKHRDYSTDNKYIRELKVTTYDNYGYSKDTPIWKYCKEEISNQFKDVIKAEIEKVLSSDEMTERLTKMADEVIDYALNGYRNELIANIRHRLVGDQLSPYDYSLAGTPIRDIINDEINKRLQ